MLCAVWCHSAGTVPVLRPVSMAGYSILRIYFLKGGKKGRHSRHPPRLTEPIVEYEDLGVSCVGISEKASDVHVHPGVKFPLLSVENTQYGKPYCHDRE